MDQVHEAVAGNRYPGRGVLWARTMGGALCGGYFLTGRSPASQARALRRGDGELIVSPTTESGHDPLRHYVAARERDGWLVFGNGEQVAVVSDRLQAGTAPAEALGGLGYEPDPPIFTSRITVAADLRGGRDAWFGAARRSGGGRAAADVLTLAVRDLLPGDAVLMTTYRSDGDRVAAGEPFIEARTEAADHNDLLEELWGALAPQFRVAVAVFEPGRLADAAIRHEFDNVLPWRLWTARNVHVRSRRRAPGVHNRTSQSVTHRFFRGGTRAQIRREPVPACICRNRCDHPRHGRLTLATFSNLNAASGYVQHTYDVSAYSGQTVTLKFTGAEDSEDQTSFVIDDTALNVS